MGHTKFERIKYQYDKIAYHFARLQELGEKTDKILEKMLMSQTLPSEESSVEEPKENEILPLIELVGQVKYPKEWNSKKLQAMYVRDGEQNSSMELLFEVETGTEERRILLERLLNNAAQKTRLFLKGHQTGQTGTGKPSITITHISNKKFSYEIKNLLKTTKLC